MSEQKFSQEEADQFILENTGSSGLNALREDPPSGALNSRAMMVMMTAMTPSLNASRRAAFILWINHLSIGEKMGQSLNQACQFVISERTWLGSAGGIPPQPPSARPALNRSEKDVSSF